MSDWLDIMLAEIARKHREDELAQEEFSRRADRKLATDRSQKESDLLARQISLKTSR